MKKQYNNFLTLMMAMLTFNVATINAQSGCPGYVTYSIGGWGTTCNGGNGGCVRDAHFTTVFPNGVTIGCANGYTVHFSSAAAVQSFLPSGGTSAVLTANETDPSGAAPSGRPGGNLTSQLLGLTLAAKYDQAIANFAPAEGRLIDLKIANTSTAFDGLTVAQFLTIANNVLGGCNNNYTPASVAAVAALLNLNYDGVNVNNGYLVCATKPMELSINGVNNKCKNGAIGSVDLTVSEGTAPYTYKWSNNATTQDLSNLSAGTYKVVVTDAASKKDSISITITEPTLLVASATNTNVLCNGGNNATADLSVSGGVAPYSYAWNNNATSEDLSSLTAGTYSVTATDANGCTATASVTVTEPTLLVASATNTNVLCNGGNNATADLTVSGGVAPHSYAWNNNATSEDLSSLTAGTYSVTATDANGCTATASVTVTEPTLLVASATNTNVLCNGGNNATADLSVSGGVAPYSFAWNNNATSEDLSSLTAGTYSVTATDANGCTATASVTVTEPALLLASATNTNVLCKGGNNATADLTISGGVAPYSYAWNNSATSEDLSSLTAGTYSVTATDANGCSANASLTVTEPSLLTANTSVNNVSCNGGNNASIDLSVTGGVAPYSYTWNNNATSEDLSGITAGSYTVNVLDANGCSASTTSTVTQPEVLKVTLTSVSPFCNGGTGKISSSVSGGNPAYNYSWNTSPVQTSATASNLALGTYTVTVTDSKGCITSGSVTVTNPTVASGFLTYTQGGWGACPNGNNPGAYLSKNFASIGNIVVGANGKTVTLTSASAIDAFLPSGGKSTALTTSYTNPGGNLSNTLVGQAVTLAISMKFDAAIAAYAPNAGYIGNQVISTGTFKGVSISQLMNIANQAIGGSTVYSISDIVDALTKVNENFDAGINKGYVFTPCNNLSKTGMDVVADNETSTINSINGINATCYPNPANSDLNITLGIGYDSEVAVEIYNLNGEKVMTVLNGKLIANEWQLLNTNVTELNAGIYFCRITTDRESMVQKLVVTK